MCVYAQPQVDSTALDGAQARGYEDIVALLQGWLLPLWEFLQTMLSSSKEKKRGPRNNEYA
jgi:hypothetical protein